jgi:hypothetical protein
MHLTNKKTYDPFDDDSGSGFRRPPNDPACVCDYFTALAMIEDDGAFMHAEMAVMLQSPKEFFPSTKDKMTVTFNLRLSVHGFKMEVDPAQVPPLLMLFEQDNFQHLEEVEEFLDLSDQWRDIVNAADVEIEDLDVAESDKDNT